MSIPRRRSRRWRCVRRRSGGLRPDPDAHAREPRRAKPPIVATKGAFFALSVPDLAASSEWYSKKLGLEVVLDVPNSNGVAVKVLEGGGIIVELVQHDTAATPECAATEAVQCHGVFKAGILVKDLDRTLANLAGRGVPVAFGPYPAQQNQRANAIIRDKAGNLIQLIER